MSLLSVVGCVPAPPSKKQLATLANLAKHPKIYHISRDFPCVKTGLSMNYEYDYPKKGRIMKLIFNQPITELECGRIIHSIRKRLKRSTQHYNQPKTVLVRKINDVLSKLRFNNIFGHNQIIKNKQRITRHLPAYRFLNDMCPGGYTYEDCECSLVLRKEIRPTGKILRFLSRKQAQDEKFATRQKEIRGLISLAKTLYDLHWQNHHLFDVICPTIAEKVEYICKLIKLYNEEYRRAMDDDNPQIPMIAFYIKVLDTRVSTFPLYERKVLLQPFNDETYTNGRSIHNTLRYLFTTKHINNEAPHILAALANTRCKPGSRSPCSACDAFLKNLLRCERRYTSNICPKLRWLANNYYCDCPNTDERPGTSAPCQNWTYIPPAPRKAYDYDDYDDDYY